jgi:putative membrane protein
MAVEMNQTAPTLRNAGINAATAALAGLVASLPMGLVMIGLNRYLPRQKGLITDRRTALPPKQITAKMARRAGAETIVPPGRTWGLTTWLAHMGYGAAAASLFPLLTRPLRLPAVMRGVLFGLAVWTGSYQGWLPAARVLPAATDLPGRRNAVMILSHIVWGTMIGLLVKKREADNMRQDFVI